MNTVFTIGMIGVALSAVVVFLAGGKPIFFKNKGKNKTKYAPTKPDFASMFFTSTLLRAIPFISTAIVGMVAIFQSNFLMFSSANDSGNDPKSELEDIRWELRIIDSQLVGFNNSMFRDTLFGYKFDDTLRLDSGMHFLITSQERLSFLQLRSRLQDLQRRLEHFECDQ